MPFFPTVCGLIFFLGFATASGFGAKNKSDTTVTLPVLVTRDSGGPSWTNLSQLQAAAAKGVPQACFELAERHLHADGVARDIPKAVALLEIAGDGGVPDAWFRLGKIYHDGLTGQTNYDRCLDYYSKAARAGVSEAQHNIGAMLVSARGVKRDFVEGLAWLIVARKSGADSKAESQVRNRLARRPKDISAAEARAQEIANDLEHADVLAVRKSGAAAPLRRQIKPPSPAVVNKSPLEEPTITAPQIAPPAPPKISLPLVSPPALPVMTQP